MMKLIIVILFSLLVLGFAIPSRKNFTPITIAINNEIAIVLSCKRQISNTCQDLRIIAKLGFSYQDYANIVYVNKDLASNKAITLYAVSKIDNNNFVLTFVTTDNVQIISTFVASNYGMNVTHTFPSIQAGGLQKTDIISLGNGDFLLTGEFEEINKFAALLSSNFYLYTISVPKTGTISSIDVKGENVLVVETSPCETNSAATTLYLLNGDACSYTTAPLCSDKGASAKLFTNTNFLFAIVANEEIPVFTYKGELTISEPLKKKKKVEGSFDWNSTPQLRECQNVQFDITDDITISGNNGANSISSFQITVGNETSSNIDYLITSSVATSKCSLEGTLLSVEKSTGNITEPESPIFRTVSCGDLGFDRILFNDDFYLFKYKSTPINLNIH